MSATTPLLRARDVAELLDVSVATVLRWTQISALPAFRMPSGALRYREAEVLEWLEARRRS